MTDSSAGCDIGCEIGGCRVGAAGLDGYAGPPLYAAGFCGAEGYRGCGPEGYAGGAAGGANRSAAASAVAKPEVRRPGDATVPEWATRYRLLGAPR